VYIDDIKNENFGSCDVVMLDRDDRGIKLRFIYLNSLNSIGARNIDLKIEDAEALLSMLSSELEVY
jgi:hypothetical protein